MRNSIAEADQVVPVVPTQDDQLEVFNELLRRPPEVLDNSNPEITANARLVPLVPLMATTDSSRRGAHARPRGPLLTIPKLHKSLLSKAQQKGHVAYTKRSKTGKVSQVKAKGDTSKRTKPSETKVRKDDEQAVRRVLGNESKRKKTASKGRVPIDTRNSISIFRDKTRKISGDALDAFDKGRLKGQVYGKVSNGEIAFFPQKGVVELQLREFTGKNGKKFQGWAYKDKDGKWKHSGVTDAAFHAVMYEKSHPKYKAGYRFHYIAKKGSGGLKIQSRRAKSAIVERLKVKMSRIRDNIGNWPSAVANILEAVSSAKMDREGMLDHMALLGAIKAVRAGSQKGKEERATEVDEDTGKVTKIGEGIGITQLKARHIVKATPSRVEFKFRGKAGEEWHFDIKRSDSPEAVKFFRKLKAKKKPSDPLFSVPSSGIEGNKLVFPEFSDKEIKAMGADEAFEKKIRSLAGKKVKFRADDDGTYFVSFAGRGRPPKDADDEGISLTEKEISREVPISYDEYSKHVKEKYGIPVVHDMRSNIATVEMLRELSRLKVNSAKTVKARKVILKQAIEHAAKAIGDTVSVTRSTYILPDFFEAAEVGQLKFPDWSKSLNDYSLDKVSDMMEWYKKFLDLNIRNLDKEYGDSLEKAHTAQMGTTKGHEGHSRNDGKGIYRTQVAPNGAPKPRRYPDKPASGEGITKAMLRQWVDMAASVVNGNAPEEKKQKARLLLAKIRAYIGA